MKPKLYLAATPIGNYDDITLRVLNILKEVDFIICEEFKEARRLLSHFKIEKELVSLNEHNQQEESLEIFKRIAGGEAAALISDCGTPLFSDPGHLLVRLCIDKKIDVIPLPGANSLMPAISASGLSVEKFYYYGWLSPKKEIRRKELFRLKNIYEVIALLDTPYRLKAVLTDIGNVFQSNLQVVVAFNLTMHNETFFRGSVKDIAKMVEEKKLKGEYVLLLDNRRGKKNYKSR